MNVVFVGHALEKGSADAGGAPTSVRAAAARAAARPPARGRRKRDLVDRDVVDRDVVERDVVERDGFERMAGLPEARPARGIRFSGDPQITGGAAASVGEPGRPA
ncbi:hypothetical protein C5D50_03605 [Rathayibacter sp. RFBD1]|nr:hypothetical protein C5D50_03605 [Rathayibacter sp. RFBD1]PPI61464.1 hypothetical protein C5D38_03335 [Rathayibacter sp. TRS19]